MKQLPLRRRRNCKNRFGKNHRNRDQKGSGRESLSAKEFEHASASRPRGEEGRQEKRSFTLDLLIKTRRSKIVSKAVATRALCNDSKNRKNVHVSMKGHDNCNRTGK